MATYTTQQLTISDFINDINSYYLPAIQREFVWSAEKIEALFDSLLRGYPIGTMMRWDVRKPALHDFQFYELIRNFDVRKPHNIKANVSERERAYGILDGQQRITSLFIGLKGSYIQKLPKLWWNNPDAFPKKQLYINLLFKPEPDADQLYQIKFLTEEQAEPSDGRFWFQVGEILKYQDKNALREFRRSSPYCDVNTFEDTLDTLWTAVHEQRSLIFFNENRQDLDEVLQIFVRLNTGGTPLSYSDLLLSLATATWKAHDAREEVTNLVDYLNQDCGEFAFSKDFVLKTALVLSGGDVRFKATNIKKKAGLENVWERTEQSLKVTAKLLSTFGLDGRTLTAPFAAIPIAYYLFLRNYDQTFLSQSQYANDREAIRTWLLKIILARVFRGQTDQTLAQIREVIRQHIIASSPVGTFPSDAIFDQLAKRRGFLFTRQLVESVVRDTTYGDPYAFAVLALLFPFNNYSATHFHVDHLHPISDFTPDRLSLAGMGDDSIEQAIMLANRVPNLQLLPGLANVSKNAKPLGEWLSSQPNPGLNRELSLIPDVDLSLSSFRGFYEARTKLLEQALYSKLGAIDIPAGAQPLTVEDLATGQVDEA